MPDNRPLVINNGACSELPGTTVLAVNSGAGGGIDVVTAGPLEVGALNATVATLTPNLDANGGVDVSGANLTVASGLDADILGGAVNITDPASGNIGDIITSGQALVLVTNRNMACQVTQIAQAALAGGETNGMVIYDGLATPSSIYGYVGSEWIDVASPYGTQYTFADSLATTSNSTGIDVTKLSLPFTSLGAGTFKISYCYFWGAPVGVGLGVSFIGSIVGSTSGTIMTQTEIEPSASTANSTSGWATFTHGSATPESFRLNFRGSSAGFAFTMSDARLEIIRVE